MVNLTVLHGPILPLGRQPFASTVPSVTQLCSLGGVPWEQQQVLPASREGARVRAGPGQCVQVKRVPSLALAANAPFQANQARK